jgi:hypothetical protein
MKLTREYFDNRELGDPIPEGMSQEEYEEQSLVCLAEKWEGKEYLQDEPVPLYTKTGWYFKAHAQHHSRGPFLTLQDVEDTAKKLLKNQTQ